MDSCSLPSPFHKKTRVSHGMLMLGAGTCRCSTAGMWDRPEGMPGCLAPAAGGGGGRTRQPFRKRAPSR